MPTPPLATKTFTASVERDGTGCFIVLPFDPKAVFGSVRAPIVVTIGGYRFRSRVVAMGGPACIGLRREHRDAAGLAGGETVSVTVALDEAPRVVDTPSDLLRALKDAGALEAWKALSYTHQREHVDAIDAAKKPETRERRISAAVAMIAAKAATAKGGATPAMAPATRPAGRQANAQATKGKPSTARSGGTHSARARTSRTTSKL
jgi:hypothetical protein